ncbi:hypothetical protein [Microbacterium sp. gxy059]|uniref:hypothetical protein n=1 Tax=Microbacterium sp. gxy059 TaxID=2957199 RepID=UPI003D953B49
MNPAQRALRRRAAGALALVFLLVALAGGALVVQRAAAALERVEETGQPGLLALRSDPAAPAWSHLRPGDRVHWLIEASLADADIGSLSLELRADGALVDRGGMTASVSSCPAPFQDGAVPRCAEPGGAVVLPATSLAEISADADRIALADLRRDAPRHLLVTLALSPDADPAGIADARARIGVGLHAAGDDARSPDPLAPTGSDLAADAIALGLLALGAVGAGICLALRRSARRTEAGA